MLVKLVRETNQIPTMIREIMEGRIEQEKKLKMSDSENKEMIQNSLAHTDRELEYLRSRQTANVATINLLASLIGDGKSDEALEVLTALGESNNSETPGTANDDGKDRPNNEKHDWTSINVLEAKETKTPGTVRAWCQHVDNGNKEAFFAEKAAGKALLQSIGKQVAVKYRRMKNGAAFVIFVKAE